MDRSFGFRQLGNIIARAILGAGVMPGRHHTQRVTRGPGKRSIIKMHERMFLNNHRNIWRNREGRYRWP